MKKRILLSSAFLLAFTIVFAQETNENIPFYQSDDFYIKLTVAIVSAVLSFLVAFFMFFRQKKEKQLKQISYDLDVREVMEIPDDIKRKMFVQYDGNVISNLSNAICTIQNTGNTLIKNQEIRFKLNSESSFVENIFDPTPERELKVKPIENLSPKERIIKIGHFDKGQKLVLKFMTSGEKGKIELHPFNEEGGVEFNSNRVTKVENDKEKLYRFFVIIAILLFANLALPHIELVGKVVAAYMTFTLKNLVNLIIFSFGFKDILSGLRILSNKILEKIKQVREFNIDNAKNVIVDSKLDVGQNAQIGDRGIPIEEEK